MGPALLFLLAAAPSDMVAPGSVTSRLGSVFPFLLVLVDLQYEGKPCPAERSELAVRSPGASPPLPGRESRGGPGGGQQPGLGSSTWA